MKKTRAVEDERRKSTSKDRAVSGGVRDMSGDVRDVSGDVCEVSGVRLSGVRGPDLVRSGRTAARWAGQHGPRSQRRGWRDV